MGGGGVSMIVLSETSIIHSISVTNIIFKGYLWPILFLICERDTFQ